jgi:hypothetical protein
VAVLTIPYGTAGGQPGGPAVTIDRDAHDPLRLNDGPYSYEDGIQGPGASTAERLAFLRDHLTELCDMWGKRPRQFVDLYFRFIARVMERDRVRIEEKTRALGGLFAAEDFAFSALRPLPRAHLEGVRVDFVFWTGSALIAIDIPNDDSHGPAWEKRGAAFAAAGVQALEIPSTTIARDDPALLESLLPRSFAEFWQGEALPSSPFKASGLGDAVTDTPDF